MKRLITILLLALCAYSQAQVNFSFTPIPLTTDYLSPGRGAHLWIKRDDPFGTIDIPVNNAPQEMVDYYYRFSWTHFFTGTGSDSTINWSFFRARMAEATSKRMGVRFRVMANGKNIGNPPSDNFNNLQQYDGGWQNIPEFLHDLQQAESNPDNRDYLSTFGGGYASWVPNTNSPQFQRWVRKFSQQLWNYIDTAVINGWPLENAIRIYDLGFYGCFSEQHSACLCNTMTDGNIPSGARPNNNNGAGLIEIVDAQLDGLGGKANWKYVVPFNAYDAVWLGHTLNPVAYGQYLLDHPDSLGWVNDHIGANEGYDHSYLEDNNRLGTRSGTPRQTILANRWRYSPLGGEPVGWGSPADRSAIPAYVDFYHMTFFGNGNLDHIAANGADDDGWPTEANNIRAASRRAGYRLRLTGGSANVGASLAITLNWLNEGNAPPYHDWDVKYLIRNGGGTTVATLNSNFEPRYFQPSGAATPSTQTFGIPAIPAGTYGLYVKVLDATGYTRPMRLAITGATADTAYFLGNITLPGGGGNQLPVANAGPNQSITISSATLSGSGTDADGTISTYAWSQVGTTPNVASITSPSSASTGVTGLINGVYTFNLTVTDNLGATGSDQVQITVATGNQAPIANAGPNQSITTAGTSLSGSGTDDVGIVSYLWSQQSGPNTAVITTTSVANPTLGNLITGTYIFRLTVSDAGGLTGFDDVSIIVGSGNLPPHALYSGGPVVMTLPSNSSTFSGVNSTDDVAVTSYLWTQVGGPASVTINTPNSVSTIITYPIAGNYVIRLTVFDAGGLSDDIDVQVTVNPNLTTAPTADAGPDQIITLPTNTVNLDGSGSIGSPTLVYGWTKVDGPATFTIVSPTSATTAVNNLIAGVYVFRLTVTNSSGTSTDEVTVTVLAAANIAPIANAGGNTSIQLPTTTVSADGTGSTDADGTITGYLWTFISGPTIATFSAGTSSTTNVNSMSIAGTYVVRLRVTDNGGLTDVDDKTIIVNAAANNAPVAIITTGTPTIQLPTNTVNLSGTSSTDDVAVTGYLWTQQSGPSTATIATPTGSTTNMNNLIAGVYFFQLQVSDAGGLTDTDIIMITVNAADPPDPPLLDGRALFKTGVKFLPRYGHP